VNLVTNILVVFFITKSCYVRQLELSLLALLICIWGDQEIQRKLDGLYRNAEVFEEIAKASDETGIDVPGRTDDGRTVDQWPRTPMSRAAQVYTSIIE